MKTVRGVFKRFTLTGHDVLKSKHSGKSHLNMNKGRRRVRRLAETVRTKQLVIVMAYVYVMLMRFIENDPRTLFSEDENINNVVKVNDGKITFPIIMY